MKGIWDFAMACTYTLTSSDDDDIVQKKPTPKKVKTRLSSDFTAKTDSETSNARRYSTRKRAVKPTSFVNIKRKIESDEDSLSDSFNEEEESSDSEYAPEVIEVKPKRVPQKKSAAPKAVKKVKKEIKVELCKEEKVKKEIKVELCKEEKVKKEIKEEHCKKEKNAVNEWENFPEDDKTDVKTKKIKMETCSPSTSMLNNNIKFEGDDINNIVDSKPAKKAPKRKISKEEVDLKKKAKPDIERNINVNWEEAQVLAEDLQLDYYIAKNIIRLFDEDNTIPFIARYRKEMTGNMSPEKLREVKEAYETLKNVKIKAASMVKNIMKMGKLNSMLESEILSARSMGELEHINASYKTSAKGTLAERARELGLETPALTVLCGNSMEPIRPELFVCHQKTKGLATPQDVETGIQHIIADFISKDRGVRDLARSLKNSSYISILCTKSKSAAKTKKDESGSSKGVKRKLDDDGPGLTEEESKYQNYFDFKSTARTIRPHQVLAINRGEKNKILSVKIDVPQKVRYELYGFIQRRWLNQGLPYPLRYKLVEQSFNDAYERLILPLIIRQVRSELTQIAETASVEVFASNLKNLLLQPPLRGNVVMGVDPGFTNGCKIAVISHTGDVLQTDVIYPNFRKNIPIHEDNQAYKLKYLIHNHRCETIALGNGTACRETEEYLGRIIQSGWFKPLDVVYTIVSEQGASIYSCSPEAKKEFPSMDTNLISAVSIARRLQDPLGELVKIEPRHLGVGMYQHDIPDTKLRSTLDEVVIECVSFVGVDLNTASQCILRRIAGLNATRAQNIIDWRISNGTFRNREQIKEVKGIGAKTFEQCAGFIRILHQTCGVESFPREENVEKKKGKTSKSKKNESYHWNPLDSTWIHPESYAVAEKIIKRCGANLDEMPSLRFIDKIKYSVAGIGLKALSLEMNISEELTKLVTDGLTQSPDHDFRSQFTKPLFRRSVKSMADLQIGDVLSGKVRNVTHFGAFIDIGVGRDGLLPSGRLRMGMSLPQLGDRVEVQIVQVDMQRRRITLDLIPM